MKEMAPPEEFNKMFDRIKNELGHIKSIINDESFDRDLENYDLKFHIRVAQECFYMLREMSRSTIDYF